MWWRFLIMVALAGILEIEDHGIFTIEFWAVIIPLAFLFAPDDVPARHSTSR